MSREDPVRARAGAITIIAIACLVLAGCGGDSIAKTTSASAGTGDAVAFSKCMRVNGLPSFPDPGTPSSGPANMIGGVSIPASIDAQSPAFEGAMHACRGLLGAALSRQGRPSISAQMKAAMIAHAQCMRTHGVPGYQDPQFPASGGILFTDSGTNPQSPASPHAAALCSRR